jgi:hypothetical protein
METQSKNNKGFSTKAAKFHRTNNTTEKQEKLVPIQQNYSSSSEQTEK